MNLAASNPITPQTVEISQTVEIKELITKQNTNYGILIAFCVISLWAVSLSALFSLNLANLPVWLIPVAALWQMFLYTGLFITAHDAMHGSVYPQSAKINHFVGALAVFCYGLFSYKELIKKHWLHHRYPASERDPDFHDGKHTHPVLWYLYFMSRYWSWKQFIGLTIVFHLAHSVLHVSQFNLILFWIIPSILSSVQLFYFGTFLTHQEPPEGFQNSHRTQTNPLPVFWSFITCYHFGYHEEHHEYPHISWWQLPAVHRMHNSL
jgi:beta-carotene ketolase (CrtW type)